VARCVKPSRSFRVPAAPLLLSLGVHGLLFLAVWVCPTHSRRLPTLAIEDTRVGVETCSLALDSPLPLLEPADIRGASGLTIETNFNPQIREVAAAPLEASTAAGPTLSGAPLHPSASSSGSPPAGDGNRTTGSLFPLSSTAASVVFVLDRSVSMGVDNKLDLACRELLATLRRLPPATRFQVIAYNTYAETLVIDGRADLLPAEPAIVERAALVVNQLAAGGGTDHAKALRRGLALHPDVLFFVTDADDLSLDGVELVTKCNRGTAIHAIELTRLRHPRPGNSLIHLARSNGGSYRRISVGD
jgi:hypothetical protein